MGIKLQQQQLLKNCLIGNFLDNWEIVNGLVKLEAAPRIELGLKDLQSSALPLGYTAFVLGTLHILVSDDYFVNP